MMGGNWVEARALGLQSPIGLLTDRPLEVQPTRSPGLHELGLNSHQQPLW